MMLAYAYTYTRADTYTCVHVYMYICAPTLLIFVRRCLTLMPLGCYGVLWTFLGLVRFWQWMLTAWRWCALEGVVRRLDDRWRALYDQYTLSVKGRPVLMVLEHRWMRHGWDLCWWRVYSEHAAFLTRIKIFLPKFTNILVKRYFGKKNFGKKFWQKISILVKRHTEGNANPKPSAH